ncbi:acyl-CoA thioesterase [Desulfurivibrio dismutans]|uniref:acyl-CoA thioesterase n=1 Tax=Desulfurivibrio dismutans TaxID=1398908 RepID=UPI0023DB2F43|nr:acyl-CoA thioesterase [Desulfurivibrio alkaliphilus]MDF1614737.1 acyl-CoA thioesterase [Desulfurivibrio alkaliphilus]
MGFTEYFPPAPDSPAPLTVGVSRRVRFEEIDLMGIVWHGRYVSYFEDGRVALGDRYGMGYRDFIHRGVRAPIVRMHIDYHAPLYFDETMEIVTRMHWNEAMRLDYSFQINGPEARLVARGYSMQLLTDREDNLLLSPPDWIEEFKDRWRRGEWS